MASKKSHAPGKRAVVVTMLIALLGVGVFAAYVKTTPAAAHISDELRKPLEVSRPAPALDVKVEKETPTAVQTFFIPAVAGADVKLGSKAESVPAGQDAKTFLATETFKSIGIDGGRAVGVQLEGRNAIVDVNDAVVDHGFGSMEEGQFVKALQLALGQFPEVDTFQIRNGGQIVDSLGHLEITDPVKVVRPGSPETPTKPDAGSKQLGPN